MSTLTNARTISRTRTHEDTPFNREIALLAKASDGSKRDATCEWAHNAAEYPTLCDYVARGLTTIETVLTRASQLARY